MVFNVLSWYQLKVLEKKKSMLCCLSGILPKSRQMFRSSELHLSYLVQCLRLVLYTLITFLHHGINF
jgi:hypothetical protein